MRRVNPNAIKNVTPYVIVAPVRIGMVVQALQASLGTLTWLTKSFGRAIKMSEKRKDDNYIFPAMFVSSSKDHLNMLELDNWNAYSFMFSDDAETVENYEKGFRNLYKRKLSIMFWMNLDKIDNTKEGNQHLEELKEEILAKIGTTVYTDSAGSGAVQDVEVMEIFEKPENVFSEFSFEETETQFLYPPYRGIRIDLDCFYIAEC